MNIEEMKQCLAEINLVEQRITKFVDRLGLINSTEENKLIEKGILAILAEDYCMLNRLYSKLGVRERVQPLPSVLTFLKNMAQPCIAFGFAVDCKDY